MLDYILQHTNQYIEAMPKKERKKYGQFFTSKETAVFMAGLYTIDDGLETLSVVDTGAGSGILSGALMERLAHSNIKSVSLTCYENDENILELLAANLTYVQQRVSFNFEFRIITENYITSQYLDFNKGVGCSENPIKYDLVIGNPPYLKLGKHAPEAISMPSICFGAPNMYFLFAAMALFNLKDSGEMVYIIPRSWTSGAYFKKFREYFLAEGKLEHVHLFISRKKVFDKEDVLQETIIVKVRKSAVAPSVIKITFSNSNSDFNNMKALEVPYDVVVSNVNSYVYLVTTKEEVELLKNLKKWKQTLPDIGLKMKTGLTVDFRNRELLRDTPEEGTIPLFFAQHFKDGQIVFPIGKSGEYIVPNKNGLIQANRNYIFIKRFTAKEEKRRLQCGIYLADKFPTYSIISTQNKINFIDNLENDLSRVTVYGLYVLFNSSLYDLYYRILNGSTQVNSSEINTMPVPSLSIINKMGLELIASNDLTESNCDRILEGFLSGKERRGKRIS